MSTTLILTQLLRILLMATCFAGVYSSLFKHEGGFMNGGGVLYYTIQSNIWVFLMTGIYFVLSIVGAITGTAISLRFFEIARFAVLVAITITFLVFWILLAPGMEKEYLLSVNNFLVHTVTPLLFIADFFLFDRVAVLPNTAVLWALILPLYYLIFSLVHPLVNSGLRFQNESRYPYFFLDADQNGWFRLKGGLGVFWWILILLVLTLGLAQAYRFLSTVI